MTEIPIIPKEIIEEVNKNLIQFAEKSIKNYEMGEYYRYCAELDYLNAKRLFNDNIKQSYPLVLFLIQQSIEKFVKSYALILGAVSKKNLTYKKGKGRGIGHTSGRAFVYMLKNENVSNILESVNKIAPSIFEDETEKLLKEMNLEHVSRNLEEILKTKNLRRFSIIKILEQFKKIRMAIARYFTSRRKFRTDFLSLFKMGTRKMIDQVYTPERLELEKSAFLIKIHLLCFLFPLAFLTHFYESETRYPPLNKRERGPKFYMNRKLSIIKSVPDILSGLERINNDSISIYEPIKNISKIPYEKRQLTYKKLFPTELKKEEPVNKQL